MQYVAFRDVCGFEKRMADWERTESAKQILQKLSKEIGVPIKSGNRLDNALILNLVGRGLGVFVRPELVPYLQRWASRKSPTSPDYIYLLKAKQTSSYKIGITNDIARRVRTIESSSPVPIKVEFCVKHSRAKEVEKALHTKYAKHRIHYEWFTFDRLVRHQVDQDFANLDSLIPPDVNQMEVDCSLF